MEAAQAVPDAEALGHRRLTWFGCATRADGRRQPCSQLTAGFLGCLFCLVAVGAKRLAAVATKTHGHCLNALVTIVAAYGILSIMAARAVIQRLNVSVPA